MKLLSSGTMANLLTNYACDFMLIYGYDLVDNGTDTPTLDKILTDRLDYGVRLSKAVAPRAVIVAGQYGGRDKDFYERTRLPESHFMKKYLINEGIKEEIIHEEAEGRSTLDSTKRLYDSFVVPRKYSSGIIVSTSEHLPRVIFQVLDIFPPGFTLLFSGPSLNDPERRVKFLELEKRGIDRFFESEMTR